MPRRNKGINYLGNRAGEAGPQGCTGRVKQKTTHPSITRCSYWLLKFRTQYNWLRQAFVT